MLQTGRFFGKTHIPPKGGKGEELATVNVFYDNAGCGALVGYLFDFVNVFAEASFVVFSNGCNSVAGILKNFGKSFVTEGTSGAEVLVDVNFNACHDYYLLLKFFWMEGNYTKKGKGEAG
jgi:hypothetical protein